MGLALEDVWVGYGQVQALRGLDLAVGDGELLVVLGPSGSGKSTLLRVVAGLERPARGRVVIAGRDVTELRPGLRNVSMVFQSYALFPHLTVAENIAFGLEVRGTSRRVAVERAAQAASTVGCADLLGRRPSQLSGGERQRVALARAMVGDPDVFLLDEPLSNLDAELRVQTREELKALHARVGTTMVHVTHDQVEALVLGDRVAVLREGRIEQVGTPDEIWSSPATQFVARFVGTPQMNFLPAGGPLGLAPRGLPDQDCTVGVRPEGVHLGASDPASPSWPVVRVDVVGSEAHVHLGLDGAALVAKVPATDRPAVGDRVSVVVPPADVHVFDNATGLRVTGG